MFQAKPVPAPSEDKRWRIVNATMRRHGYQPSGLIETLHSMQEAFGFLDPVGLRYVARSLRVPLSQVYGVATFYNLFKLKPSGEHTCTVCLGTACYIKGAPAILSQLQEALAIKPDQTTPDKKVSLMVARCVGACGLAPVVVLDEETFGRLSPEQVVEKVMAWRAPAPEER
ncbi:MAG: hydrogenase HoxE [Candidatus Thermofonsia Clade 1 bacterium]|jgi:bidirectional [NiFe] hydrogenase diaphorase subunit|uniref:Hydrogenase HoxE n=1 Tax=Candidatus Thermofonsia Clade 1 bacterium TaxID=2364210 RepID=A0A2M8Q071_9CHLR|nr:MAG: hydrogenase HoxE [Candidatus Thermofonsia Clade 1 bacterium]PJF43207.1 MAG: hydrogenase HoxE [Candidatus Thermofonsia Clade 1 bacterium]